MIGPCIAQFAIGAVRNTHVCRELFASSLTLDTNMPTPERLEKKNLFSKLPHRKRSIDKAGVPFYLACYMPKYSTVAEIGAVT